MINHFYKIDFLLERRYEPSKNQITTQVDC